MSSWSRRSPDDLIDIAQLLDAQITYVLLTVSSLFLFTFLSVQDGSALP